MSTDPDCVFDVPPGVAAVPLSVLKIRDDTAIEAPDHLAVEEPLEIRLGGMAFTVTMRIPGHDEDLVAGLLHAEGVIRDADSIDVIARYRGPDEEPDAGNVINVILKADLHVARERLRRSLVSSSACGVCGKVSIEAIRTACDPVSSAATVAPALFPRLAADIKNADVILINGANPAEAHPVGFQWFMQAKLDPKRGIGSGGGAKIIHRGQAGASGPRVQRARAGAPGHLPGHAGNAGEPAVRAPLAGAVAAGGTGHRGPARDVPPTAPARARGVARPDRKLRASDGGGLRRSAVMR
jgi:hypothetical protein